MSRNNEAAAKAIVDAFEWVGLQHDGVITYQSQRMSIYKKYIEQLLDEGKAYKCLVIVLWNGRKVAVTKTPIKDFGKEKTTKFK